MKNSMEFSKIEMNGKLLGVCVQELEWCRINSEVICNKANVLYKKYISSEPFSGRNRCLNFPKLESECEKYNSKTKRGTD